MIAMDTLSPDLRSRCAPRGSGGRYHSNPDQQGCADRENAGNLDQVVGKRFRVSVLPLPLSGCDASPVRIVAEI